jgi:outer membrane murein-binding lipoprotein Lpp
MDLDAIKIIGIAVLAALALQGCCTPRLHHTIEFRNGIPIPPPAVNAATSQLTDIAPAVRQLTAEIQAIRAETKPPTPTIPTAPLFDTAPTPPPT